ncbi:hypothetical protein CURE108131_22985 [Cupriavidus respiraculi]|uniref:Ferredoxin n=1 Tax=Cupriavidus respiraculi TaxID=195930 RepID=A0ABM8WY67_9BURK|nr:hypothetical protein [Cupriavidus respiraculi]CAG9172517.1 hypothetical protein LMG21510_01998 [Cupriavidus respiraculi]
MEAARLSAKQVEDCLALNPFDGDFGSPGDMVFADRVCLARKPGTCNDCLGAINAGEQQRRLDAKFDDTMRSYRWCALCCHAMALSWHDNGAALQARWILRARANQQEGRDNG